MKGFKAQALAFEALGIEAVRLETFKAEAFDVQYSPPRTALEPRGKPNY